MSQFVELKETNGEWWGLSCFKDEKTPSFSVRNDPPVFFDYSSGIGGNVFTFVKYYYKCTNVEAVKRLSEYLGEDYVQGSSINKKLTATISCKKFFKKSNTVKPAKSKALSKDHMDRYENNTAMLDVWLQEGISKDIMKEFQVKYDSFSNRLVYPIKNLKGEIVNIGGRTLDSNWKEKNLKKYCYFYNWGTLDVIYGLFENRKPISERGEIIIFEGCKSVLIAKTWGINNCGAILTSHLNPNQMKILARLGGKIVFALDKDVDISKDHNINKLKNYVSVEIIKDTYNILESKDSPVDKGEYAFRELYKKRIRIS